MKKLSLLVALVAAAGMLKAQTNYKQGIGVRFSTHNEYDAAAVSYKFFVSKPGAIELNLGIGDGRYAGLRANAVSFAGTYQHHFDIKPVPGLKWFIGGGLVAFHTNSKNPDYDGTGLGIYPTGGADYKFKNIPLNLSADFRPTFHIAAPAGYSDFHAHDVGVAARFTF